LHIPCHAVLIDFDYQTATRRAGFHWVQGNTPASRLDDAVNHAPGQLVQPPRIRSIKRLMPFS
jgi:hypothetical protein